MMARGSFHDSRGMLFVDCAECDRGGNGTDPEKCAAGWQETVAGAGGCFAGELMTNIEIPDGRLPAVGGVR